MQEQVACHGWLFKMTIALLQLHIQFKVQLKVRMRLQGVAIQWTGNSLTFMCACARKLAEVKCMALTNKAHDRHYMHTGWTVCTVHIAQREDTCTCLYICI